MILFLNHKTVNCGVYQFGKRIGVALQDSEKYDVLYCEINSGKEFEYLISHYNPESIIYNYYPSTMFWLDGSLLEQHRGIAHIGIFHEVPTTIFDYYIHIDPTFIDNGNHFGVGRLLPDYTNNTQPPRIMTVGTFGFGLGGKNYHLLVEKVNDEFDEAVINLHISHAAFGDSEGIGARNWAELCTRYVTKPGIHLNISHNFLSEEVLLDFLAQNTINAFHYDLLYGRGIASVTDYALAVGRPLAITRSYMFRHIYPTAPEICMEDHSFADIASRGIAPIEQFMVWNKENFIERFETIYDSIKNARSI